MTDREIVLAIFSGLLTITCVTLVVLLKMSRNENKNYVQEEVSYRKVVATTEEKHDLFESESPEKTNELFPNNTSSDKQSQNSVQIVTEQMIPLPNTANWGKAEILNYLSQSVNKTKQLKGTFTVHHTESFTADILECTGGNIGKLVANKLMGYVVKPSEEDYSFSNGRCTTAEGENVEILLPKNGAFSVYNEGVSSAKAYTEGEYTVISIKLVEEDCGFSDVPKYNKNAIGYLNPSEFDLMGIEISDAQINYLGSTVTMKIDRNGYVKFAEYKIPLYVSGKGAKGSLSGYAVFNGEQTETWVF